MSLKSQVAIVSGGDKGIGAIVSKILAREDAGVIIAARDQKAMDQLLETIRSLPGGERSSAILTDVTDETSVQSMVDSVVKKHNRIDILVNTAGVIGPVETPLHKISVRDWEFVLDVNLKGTFLCCKAVVPVMIRQRSGRIVNIAGTSGLRGYKNRAAYSSSKWAVRGLTRTLALEVGQYNINVNDICPGVVEGDRMSKIIAEKAKAWGCTEDDVKKTYNSEMALGRFTTPEDIANTVLFLVGEAGRQITGHDIVVDGGWDV